MLFAFEQTIHISLSCKIQYFEYEEGIITMFMNSCG